MRSNSLVISPSPNDEPTCEKQKRDANPRDPFHDAFDARDPMPPHLIAIDFAHQLFDLDLVNWKATGRDDVSDDAGVVFAHHESPVLPILADTSEALIFEVDVVFDEVVRVSPAGLNDDDATARSGVAAPLEMTLGLAGSLGLLLADEGGHVAEECVTERAHFVPPWLMTILSTPMILTQPLYGKFSLDRRDAVRDLSLIHI